MRRNSFLAGDFNLRLSHALALLLVSASAALFSCSPPPAPTEIAAAEPTDEVTPEVTAEFTPEIALTCDDLISSAIEQIGTVCSALGNNQACYGNSMIEVEFQPGAEGNFDSTGDIVNLLDIRRLSAHSVTQQAQQLWGIAVVKAQANLEGSIPGQAVTLLLFGETTLDNISPDLRAIALSTGIGEVSCEDTPASGLLIQSPQGQRVTMNFNGADITLASTLFLTAPRDAEMTVSTIEGTGEVSAFGETQVIEPGAQVKLPIDENFQVAGPPSQPEPFDVAAIEAAPLPLLEREVVIPPPIPTLVPTSTRALANLTQTARPSRTPTLAPTACAPRSDWTDTYTVELGDTMNSIARQFNITARELQDANCIADANSLNTGQTLVVPFALPTATPEDTATPTEAAASISFTADVATIASGECAILTWEAADAETVFFEGQPADSSGSEQVCPTRTTIYTLLVTEGGGQPTPYRLTITVEE